MRPRARHLVPVAAVLAALGTVACQDPGPDAGEPELGAGAAVEVDRLARVHVIAQPRGDELGIEARLSVEGRFAEFSGMDPASAAVRADLAPLPADQLREGQCAALSSFGGTLSGAAGPADEAPELDPDADPELLMLDAGDMRITLGNEEVVVPLALVPDLVPWVSGVEYDLYDDRLPALGLAPDGMTPVTVALDGAPDGSLPRFEARLGLPAVFELLPAIEDGDESALWLEWKPPEAAGATIAVELHAYQDGDPSGATITCVLADSGAARLETADLSALGLGEGDLVRVTARRISREMIEAPGFGPVEVVAELRDQQLLPMPG